MRFPKNFLFGTANADHQVEAYDPEHEDVWDLWEKHQGLTPRKSATDFWNRYEEDIAAAAALGCKLFRFSIAWARIEPECGKFDQAAINHYEKLADCVIAHDMKLMVTLHHFVWPAWLERDYGGMIGKEFPDLFARYGKVIAEAFGQKVDWWITFNEPSQLTFGYIKPWWQSRYYMPPGLPRGSRVDAEAEAVGKLVPNLFLAHARVRREIKALRGDAQVGVNPLVTGFPNWLQMLLDWVACHQGLAQALFKFTTESALFSERGRADLVIAGISATESTVFESSDPYLRTGKAILTNAVSQTISLDQLAGKTVGVIDLENQPGHFPKYFPKFKLIKTFADYRATRDALAAGEIDAVYGDAFLLFPPELEARNQFKFLTKNLTNETYVALAPHGHHQLIQQVNRAIENLLEEDSTIISPSNSSEIRPIRPTSLHEVFSGKDSLSKELKNLRGLRRIIKRKKVRIALRSDTEKNGLEHKLAEQISKQIFGRKDRLEIIRIPPKERFEPITNKGKWLNWAWRFWGTTSLIANVNWWYLGMGGKLASELCPEEAIGAQDFIGLDYYWGLPTHRLHRFRLLEEAAHGRFLKAPVWPRGLYHALRRLHRWFPDKELMIVENGCTPTAGGVTREEYMKAHLREVANAIDKKVPVRAYNWWSITSNREWGHPFDPNTDFGLYFVDLDNDPSLNRKKTPEADIYKQQIDHYTR